MQPKPDVPKVCPMSQEATPIHPTIGKSAFIAPTAYVGGDVTIGDECTIMHHVVIRGDVARITIGRRSNVQDGAVIHTKTGVPLEMGDLAMTLPSS